MEAASIMLLFSAFSDNPSLEISLLHIAMVSCFTFLLSLIFFILVFTMYAILKNNISTRKKEKPIKIQSFQVNADDNISKQPEEENCFQKDSGNVNRSMLLEILPSNSPKWDTLFSESNVLNLDPDEKNGLDQGETKRKKKRAKKKKPDPIEEEGEEKFELMSLFRFVKSSSSTQRKIKQQFDQIVKSHGSKGLTLDQMAKFVDCLVEARNEMLNRSEVIKRRFTINKALLFKADRSSFVRLRQQIYKLESEQKRLEEDALLFNWLQEQLKASPAYKKMLEISASMETKAKSNDLVESTDDDCCDISFEELLEREKKDAFWQRNGRLRPCSG